MMIKFLLTALTVLCASAGVGHAFDLYPHCPVRDEPCGYINAKGEWIIQPQWDYAADFDEVSGTAIVKQDGKYGLINLAGDLRGAIEYDMIFSPEHNLPHFYRAKIGESFVLIDSSGRVQRQERFEQIGYYGTNGLAAAKQDGKYGLIDQYGRWVVAPTFEKIDRFALEGLAPASKNKKWGYINAAGEWVIAPKFDDAMVFFEHGRARVKIGSKYGFIDPAGNMVIPAQYDLATWFSEVGLASVKKDGKYGAIDASGKTVIPFQFEDIKAIYTPTNIAAKLNGRWGTIDGRGNWLIRPDFDLVGYFGDSGVASYVIGKLWGCINAKGEVTVPAQYSSIWCRAEGEMTRVWFNGNDRSGYLGERNWPIGYKKSDLTFPERSLCSTDSDVISVRNRKSTTKGTVVIEARNGLKVRVVDDLDKAKSTDFVQIVLRNGQFSDEVSGFVPKSMLRESCDLIAAQSAVRQIAKIANRSYDFNEQFGKFKTDEALAGRTFGAHYTYGFGTASGRSDTMAQACHIRFSLTRSWDSISVNGERIWPLGRTERLTVDLMADDTSIGTLTFDYRMGEYDELLGFQHGGTVSFEPKGDGWSRNRTELVVQYEGRSADIRRFDADREMMFIEISPDARPALRWLFHLEDLCQGKVAF